MVNRKITIGLFTDSISGATDFEDNIWKGVYDYTTEKDINLICFPGDNIILNKEKKFANPRNLIYNYASENILDGLILATTAITSFISKEDYKNFINRFKNIPVVSIGKAPADIPMSIIDNKSGMRELISHLIEKHRKSKIAFISGPLDNPDAQERLEAYQEVLKYYGIPFDEKYVFNGTFLVESGAKAIESFITERKIDFDAVVAANDQMAFGAINALNQRGIKIPTDVAVTGFDDTIEASFTSPPLSTVMQPVYKQSRNAAELLLDLIKNGSSEKLRILKTEMRIRQSCGCLSEELENIKEIGILSEPIENKKSHLLNKLKNSKIDGGNLAFIVDSIINEIENKNDSFISDFNSLINDFLTSKKEVRPLQSLISSLRSELVAIYSTEFELIERLMHKARIIISEALIREQSAKNIETLIVNNTLRQAIFLLSGNFELKDFLENFQNALKNLNIPAGYIMLKQNDKLEFLYGFQIGRGVLKPEQKLIDEKDLLPSNVWPEKRFALIVFPLLFRNETLGILLLQIGSMYSFVYETLFGQISSSLKGVTLFEKSRKIEAELTEKNKKLEGLMIPMLNSIEEISSILKEREKMLGQLNDATRESYEKLFRTNEIIESISNYTNKMIEIINIIDDISMTVNLVALNASIESTHAGEYGKGFAIIAKEIKKLSDSTKKNAEEISNTLKNVVKNIKESMVSGQETLKMFKDQEKIILELLDSLLAVSDEVKKLSISSKEILETMKS
ncbi:MAG: substrate-binding domain-containing protein [Brevinematia bacterium]